MLVKGNGGSNAGGPTRLPKAYIGPEVSIVAEIAIIKRGTDPARERSERERRRLRVARLRWLEANLTAAEIVTALEQLKPPIITSIRTVERDFIAIRDDARRYLTAVNFDARFEVGEALARHELIARTATRRALAGDGDAAKWARVVVQATSARAQLLQDIGLIDRQIGTLFVDDGQRADRIPFGVELQAMFRDVNVTEDEITSEAEWHYQHGDAAAYEAASRAAVDGHSPDNRRTVR